MEKFILWAVITVHNDNQGKEGYEKGRKDILQSC